MPSEVRDLQSLTSSSFFSENIPNERQVGFWKSDNMLHGYANEKLTASSSLEKRLSMEHQNKKSLEPQMHDKRVICNLNKLAVGAERPTTKVEASPYFGEGGKVNVMGSHYESSLFSSSLSDLFSQNLRMSSNSALYGHSVDTVASHYEEEEIIESLEEMEAQTIGNLLPNDDDLLSGVADGLDHNYKSSIGDELDELDLFSSVGGMDLEDDFSSGVKSFESSDGSIVGEHPLGEHPSRTLFVRNINSNIEDSELKTLFEQYGDIRTLYTACKHRGFVMISYYDLRAAQRAMKALQNKPLRRRRLDIHYSIPKENPSEKDVNQGTLVVFNLDSSVSNDELCQIFGVYGEVKEIRETPQRSHHKFIEFYDIRGAEAALHALNRSDVAGKQIKLEPSRPGSTQQVGLQLPTDLEQDEYSQQSSPPVSLTTAFSVQTSSVEPAFHHGISSSVPNGLSSLVRNESLGNQSSAAEMLKFNIHATSAFHPHSLPEYHEGLANSVRCNSAGNLFAGVNSRQSERIDSKQYSRVNSSANELNESVFGSVGNGSSCAVPGHHYAWNNTYRSQPPGMMWPSSPSFVNGVCAVHPQPRLHGIPRAPSHMLNPLLMNNHHVGSAPVVNPSLWDTCRSFAGESPDSSAFHPGSLGSLGLSNSPHSMEFLSRNFFPRVGGNMDLSIPSKTHHQSCMMFQGRSQMIPVMNSFDPSGDRGRTRRNDGNTNQTENRRQYELDVDRIMRGEDNRTTLMIKNIPNKYTSKMLLAAIDERHRGTYDFIYLPIDFKNKCNVGYAFINMIDPRMIIPFCQSFNGKKWEKFNSEKVASLAYGRIQGKSALIAHFQNSSLMNEDKRCRPILFNTDGPNAGDQVPFPMGVNVRTRPGKGRSTLPEEFCHGSPPNSAFGDDSFLGETSGFAKESD